MHLTRWWVPATYFRNALAWDGTTVIISMRGLSGPVLLNEKQKGTTFKMQNNNNNPSNGITKGSSFSSSRSIIHWFSHCKDGWSEVRIPVSPDQDWPAPISIPTQSKLTPHCRNDSWDLWDVPCQSPAPWALDRCRWVTGMVSAMCWCPQFEEGLSEMLLAENRPLPSQRRGTTLSS